jgi:hypothetical protein
MNKELMNAGGGHLKSRKRLKLANLQLFLQWMCDVGGYFRWSYLCWHLSPLFALREKSCRRFALNNGCPLCRGLVWVHRLFHKCECDDADIESAEIPDREETE